MTEEHQGPTPEELADAQGEDGIGRIPDYEEFEADERIHVYGPDPITPIEPVTSEHPIKPDTETVPIIINCYISPSEDDPEDVSISGELDVSAMDDLPDEERAAALATAAGSLNFAMISMVAHGRVTQEVMGHLVMQAMGAEPAQSDTASG